MGQEIERNKTECKTIALQCDEDGNLRHDAIARLGHGKEKVKLIIKIIKKVIQIF